MITRSAVTYLWSVNFAIFALLVIAGLTSIVPGRHARGETITLSFNKRPLKFL